MNLIVLGCVGGVLPDVIRLLNYVQTPAKDRASLTWPSKGEMILRLVGLAIQVGLGGFAVYLIGAASPLQAVAIGFAGPEFLTRFLAAAVPKPPSPQSGATPQGGMIETPARRSAPRVRSLFRWWGA
jgi:hypothetical protein